MLGLGLTHLSEGLYRGGGVRGFLMCLKPGLGMLHTEVPVLDGCRGFIIKHKFTVVNRFDINLCFSFDLCNSF